MKTEHSIAEIIKPIEPVMKDFQSAFENEFKNIDTTIKIVKPENVHITLKFLGDSNENLINEINDIIKNSVKDIKPFEITLEGTGVFPNTNYIKIIWVGIKNGNKLENISKKIDNQLSKIGFNKEKRKSILINCSLCNYPTNNNLECNYCKIISELD